MDKLIQTIQDEINNLMKSKIAQKSDAELLNYENRKTPYELVNKMYQDYQAGYLSLKEVGHKYGLTSNCVKRAFNIWKFKTRTVKEGQMKHLDSKEIDIKNGMGSIEFCSKYNTTRNTYYRYKKKFKKDLVD